MGIVLAKLLMIFFILWYAMCPMSGAIAAGPDTSVTSDADPLRLSATVQEGVGGRVTSASGAPMANVFVQASSIDGPRAIPDIAVFTDPEGRYSWKLSPGTYELIFMRDGRELTRKQAVVRPNEVTPLHVEQPD